MKFSVAGFEFEVTVQAMSSHLEASCGYGMWEAEGTPKSIFAEQQTVNIK